MKKMIILSILILVPISSYALFRHHIRGTVIAYTKVYDKQDINKSVGSLKSGADIYVEGAIYGKDKRPSHFIIYNQQLKEDCVIPADKVALNEQMRAYFKSKETLTVISKEELLYIRYRNRLMYTLTPEVEVRDIEGYVYGSNLCMIIYYVNDSTDIYITNLGTRKNIFVLKNTAMTFPTVMGFSADNRYVAFDSGTYEMERMLYIYKLSDENPVLEESVVPIANMRWTNRGFYFETFVKADDELPEGVNMNYIRKCYWKNGKKSIAGYYVPCSKSDDKN